MPDPPRLHNGKKRFVKHHENLTETQCQSVVDWLRAAVRASGYSPHQITQRAGLGNSSLNTWLRGRQVPSAQMLDWLSELTGHPLPSWVRALGAPHGHLSEAVYKRQEAFRKRQGKTAGPAEASPERPRPVPANRSMSPSGLSPDQLANQIHDAVSELAALAAAPTLDFEAVQAWLAAHVDDLPAPQRLALVGELARQAPPAPSEVRRRGR